MIKGKGVDHLDPNRCVETGDPEYPLIYTSKNGSEHRLHKSRIVHLATADDKEATNDTTR